MIAPDTLGRECSPVKEGLVSWWRFEESANDIVGSNNGALHVKGSAYVPGKVGKAISIDGNGAYVSIPDAPNLSPSGSFTFEAWIMPAKDRRGTLIGKWGDELPWIHERSYAVEVMPGGNLSFGISDFAHQDDEAYHILYSIGGKLSIHEWNHIACVYDQKLGIRSIYINGKLEASRTDAPITVTKSAADLTIGLAFHAQGVPTSNPFAGSIDELSYYQRALSADEINSIYRAGSQGKCR